MWRVLFCKHFPVTSRHINFKRNRVIMGPGQGDNNEKVKVIGTHDGTFHHDEVLACFLLRQLPQYKSAQILRTRDEEILRTCDIVVDVGSFFDPGTLRFDHHQKSFHESMHSLRPEKPWTTKLSSAGLVYAHFGEEVIAHILNKKKDDEVVQDLYDKMYENFVEEVDAIDNGISQSDGPMRYRITTTLCNRVSFLNPSWREGNDKPDEMECFQKALELVGKEFLERVHRYASEWDSYFTVKTLVESRFDVDPSGEIVELSSWCPWKDHLVKAEKELQIKTPIKFVIYQDGKGKWRVQGVPITPQSFDLRTPLVETWRGIRGKELVDVSGIPTIDFVHVNGFIGGALDRQGAIQMAKLTLHKS